VITAPMPSMPLAFWDDADGARYRDAYFDTYPGVWRHGDWILINERGSAVIYGRSDSTINRQGIRMGTAELYQVVEALPEVLDSLVVDLEYLGRDSYLPLFVVLAEGAALDDALVNAIRTAVRTGLSPRHVPDDVFAITDVPRTFSGKKMEIPVRRLLLGRAAAEAINRDTMANPESIDWFVSFAAQLAADRN
ncbi:MAG: acetoacetate--CoA ligase, partial [Pseudomonadota bacterium]